MSNDRIVHSTRCSYWAVLMETGSAVIVTTDLPSQLEQAYRELAAVKGVVALIPGPRAETTLPDDMSPQGPEEWIREFRAWAPSHSDLPPCPTRP